MPGQAASGLHFAVQGNILVSAATVEALAADLNAPKASRLVRPVGGSKSGSDRRGQQSAAVLIVRERAATRASTIAI
jgi:uncharacterized Ntn-hydrolase superfamily protein